MRLVLGSGHFRLVCSGELRRGSRFLSGLSGILVALLAALHVSLTAPHRTDLNLRREPIIREDALSSQT